MYHVSYGLDCILCLRWFLSQCNTSLWWMGCIDWWMFSPLAIASAILIDNDIAIAIEFSISIAIDNAIAGLVTKAKSFLRQQCNWLGHSVQHLKGCTLSLMHGGAPCLEYYLGVQRPVQCVQCVSPVCVQCLSLVVFYFHLPHLLSTLPLYNPLCAFLP